MPVSSESWAFQSSAGSGRAQLSSYRAVVARHLLLGQRQVDATARRLERLPRTPTSRSRTLQRHVVAGRPRLEGRRPPRLPAVVEPRAAADGGAHDVDRRTSPSASRSKRQTKAGRTWSGSRLAAPSDEHRRVQRRARRRARRAVWPRRRASTSTGRPAARTRARRRWRSRRWYPSPRALEVQSLVEVHRAGRVDGDERDVGEVGAGGRVRAGRRSAAASTSGREGLRDVEPRPDRGEPPLERRDGRRVGSGEPDHTPHHAAHLRAALPAPALRWAAVLVLLPPSESKRAPAARGRPAGPRRAVLPRAHPDAHAGARTRSPPRARRPTPAPAGRRAGPSLTEVERNTRLRTLPARPALEVYSGVLYDALGWSTLSTPARRRAASRLVVVSALWGALRPGDRVPPYRLNMCGDLGPRSLSQLWRPSLHDVLVRRGEGRRRRLPLRRLRGRVAGDRGCRGPYRRRPGAAGRRERPHGRQPRRQAHPRARWSGTCSRPAPIPARPQGLARLLGERWTVELAPPPRAGRPWTLDVVLPVPSWP